VSTLVNIWSGPRNVSTALLYAFRERSDTTVVDEPLYAAWLARHPEADHPGRDEVLASQPTDPWAVVRQLLHGPWNTGIVVAKQMAAHLDGLDTDWLDACRNVVLVRAPEPVVASYAEQIERPTVEALGYPVQRRLVARAHERGERPLVLESSRLLADPAGVLERLCAALGLPFEEAMLSWPAGAKPEDGVWAPHWYARTHASTGFGAPRDREITLPAHLAEVAAAARPLYEELAALAL
jgi:hypothetical protein